MFESLSLPGQGASWNFLWQPFSLDLDLDLNIWTEDSVPAGSQII
jgi:hypothetical protein